MSTVAFKGASVEDLGESRAPIARQVLMELMRAYGRSPRVIDFLNLYADLRSAYDAVNEEESLGQTQFYRRFLRSYKAVDSRIESEGVRNLMSQGISEIQPLLRRLDNRSILSTGQWRLVSKTYADLIQNIASDKGIYLSPRRLPGRGSVRWMRLQKASPKEQSTERLRLEDPDLFERVTKSRDQQRLISDRIRGRIKAEGLTSAIRTIAGRPVNVGIDDSGDMFVYDIDGEVLHPEEFTAKIRERNAQLKALRKINPANRMRYDQLKSLRRYSEEEVDKLPGDVEYVSLTDDPDKDTALTRIYPVKRGRDGEQIVVSGRFKGFVLPDLVNAAGRQIEGSIFYYNPDTARISRREIHDTDGTLSVRKQSEPYVTLVEGRLFLKMSGKRPYAVARRRLGKLGLPSLESVPKTRLTEWFFEPQDFAGVREVIGSMALSNAASKFLQRYFDDLTRADQAAESGDLKRYSSERLGLLMPLRRHSKKALAWLDANGNRGICALDTGMGKTVTAIASMQNLRSSGRADTGNGRFLYVCETALLGNLPKEIYKFLPDEEASELIDICDITTYHRFSRARKKNPTYGDDYVAIFFDEAHLKLKNKRSSFYKTATACRCPHKVLMTASPMSKSPKEVFTMASVGLGLDLNTKAGRKKERDFVSRYAETVGGRIVGVTQDTHRGREFRQWVKRNLFFADKRDVSEEEAQLAHTGRGASGRDLRKEVVAVTMSTDIEREYRRTMSEVMEILRELIDVKYEGGSLGKALAVESSKFKLRGPLSRLSRLSDVPNLVVPGAPNLKLDQASSIMQGNIGGRVLLFTDSAELAEETYQRLQRDFPGKGHVIGLSGHIRYMSMSGEEQKYRSRKYTDPDTGRQVPRDEWKTFVLNKILGLGLKERLPVFSAVLTGTYSVGQNLQSFDTVIHLDRDNWSSETMKQRTGRAWRAGNKKAVDEYTLDMVYPTPKASIEEDLSLDQIRGIIQSIDANLFDAVVLESQSEKLGTEWLEIKKQRSALHVIDRRMMERALSPYASQLGQQEKA